MPPELELVSSEGGDLDKPIHEVTRRELSDIALAAAKEASRQTVSEIFGILGVNIADFDDMQDLRDNLTFLKRFRHRTDKVGARFAMTIVSMVAAAVGVGAWEFFKMTITGKF